MRHQLQVHGRMPTPVEEFSVEVEWLSPVRLWLRFHVEIPLGELTLPDPAEPARANDLWRETCFELFLREPETAAYCEFNFSPSGRWAAYAFEDVRQGRGDLELSTVPQIGIDASESHFALEAILTMPDAALQSLAAALCAVIVDAGGAKSYWALAHPPGQPDFHRPDCFTLELPPPDAP